MSIASSRYLCPTRSLRSCSTKESSNQILHHSVVLEKVAKPKQYNYCEAYYTHLACTKRRRKPAGRTSRLDQSQSCAVARSSLFTRVVVLCCLFKYLIPYAFFFFASSSACHRPTPTSFRSQPHPLPFLPVSRRSPFKFSYHI